MSNKTLCYRQVHAPVSSTHKVQCTYLSTLTSTLEPYEHMHTCAHDPNTQQIIWKIHNMYEKIGVWGWS